MAAHVGRERRPLRVARGASADATFADLAEAAFTVFFFADEAEAAFLAAWWVFAVAAAASAGATVAAVASNATATDTAVPSVMLCNNLRGENDSAFIGVWTKRAGGFRKCS
jgi:hypothetical protein